jgi:3-hydroxyisobutyrate dehydrogenase
MPDQKQLSAVAFIGIFVMGRSMAGHLQQAGHRLHVYNRTKAKADSLLAAGATWHDDAGSAAAKGEVVFTMLGFPQDVEETYLGPARLQGRADAHAFAEGRLEAEVCSPHL